MDTLSTVSPHKEVANEAQSFVPPVLQYSKIRNAKIEYTWPARMVILVLQVLATGQTTVWVFRIGLLVILLLIVRYGCLGR